MIRLMVLGVVSGLFFSTTFLLNQVMSMDGGHWVWSAALRYGFMILFLSVLILLRSGPGRLAEIFALFKTHWKFWILAGGIGFGGFYGLICFSADHAPGWVIAATWQFTIVASLFVLKGFGKPLAGRVWIFSVVIFAGVVMVNLGQATHVSLTSLVLGALPVLVAAFCYPFGNQMVWEAQNGHHTRIPKISSPLLSDVFSKVLLMSLGSLPLWIVLVIAVAPPLPAPSQILNTALVALFSGIFATSIFLFARNLASDAHELAGVDATQSSEVVFALVGGLVFLDTPLPGFLALSGLVLILVGLTCFALVRN